MFSYVPITILNILKSFQRPLECNIRIFIINAAILDQNLELNQHMWKQCKIFLLKRIYIYKHMTWLQTYIYFLIRSISIYISAIFTQYFKHIRKNVDSFVQKLSMYIIYYLACVSIIYHNIYYKKNYFMHKNILLIENLKSSSNKHYN